MDETTSRNIDRLQGSPGAAPGTNGLLMGGRRRRTVQGRTKRIDYLTFLMKIKINSKLNRWCVFLGSEKTRIYG